MSSCPFCDYETPEPDDGDRAVQAWQEVAHMTLEHRDVVEARLRGDVLASVRFSDVVGEAIQATDTRGRLMLVMKIVGLAAGPATPFDGQYLREYDPNRSGQDPDGNPMLAHVVTTPDPAEAMRFDGLREVREVLYAIDERQPVRDDGKPNRPLSAFTVEIVNLERAR